MYPQMADRKDERFMVIEDEPHIIELVQNPLRCLMDLLTLSWPLASEMRAVRELAKETGGAPTIFHQPYTDGPIPALTEAINFYVNQLEVGPRYSAHQQGFNQGYRSTEIVGHPPVDAHLFKVAQEITTEMFESLS
jgi:hypothetical protein